MNTQLTTRLTAAFASFAITCLLLGGIALIADTSSADAGAQMASAAAGATLR